MQQMNWSKPRPRERVGLTQAQNGLQEICVPRIREQMICEPPPYSDGYKPDRQIQVSNEELLAKLGGGMYSEDKAS